MIKRMILLILISNVVWNCNNPTDGGPCEYDIQDFVAEVIEIKPNEEKEGELRVVLDFNVSTLAMENQYLDDLKGVTTDSAFIARNRLSVGVQYTGKVSEIKTGSCKPLYLSFDQRFK